MKTPDKPGNGLISHLVLSTYKHKCALIFFLKTPTKGVFNTLCNPFTHGGSGKWSSRWQELHVQEETGYLVYS